jgi:isocitrate lyase
MDSAREAGVFHHLITPTYHTTALHMNDLAQGYFGEGMLAYVKVFRDKKFAKELPV